MLSKRRRNLVISLVAGALVLGVSGLVLVLRELIADGLPGDKFYAHSPMAFKTTADGEVEVLYTPCDDPDAQGSTPFPRRPVTGFELQVGRPAGEDRWDWETIWRVTLDEPTDLDSVIVGQVPDDATEEIPWPEGDLKGFGDNVRFAATITVEDSWSTWREGFQPDELHDQIVLFRDESMTPAEFARADRCTDPWA